MVYLAAILVVGVLIPSTVSSSPWNDPTSNQFHIQTDEGPERYFKYQTQNGQYRKEKRLEDGTVIGSYAWIDDNGYLRQRDYIADSQGYRIVKNKNIYVGRNVNVGDAVKATKKISSNTYIPPGTYNVPPSNRGYIVTPRPVISVSTASPTVEISLNSIPSSTPSTSLDSATPSPIYNYGNDYKHSSVGYFESSTPRPFALPSSSTVATPSSSYIPPVSSTTYLPPSSTISTLPSKVYVPSVTPPPVFYPPSSIGNNLPPPSVEHNTLQPSVYGDYPPSSPSPNPSTVYLPSSTPPPTPSSIYLPSSTPSSIYLPSSTPQYISITPPARKYIPQSPINTNSIEYSGSPQYEHYPEDFVNPYIHQNGPTYPIDTRGQSFNPTYNNIGNGYDPQYPYYDGISVTNDGFRYYIPKAYHEEQNVGSDTKSGSFGYVDPFGIRRVIYYNAGPDGFKHRKNNRYVGLNATPYDPRPY